MPVDLVVRKKTTLSQKRLRAALDSLLLAVHRERDALCVLLTGDAEVRDLNRRYRKKDEATDVLSFPAGAGPVQTRALGDLAISLDTAKRQAKECGHALFTEVVILCAHGLLHLLGYDHEIGQAEARRMLRRERRLLRAVGIGERDPLTARGDG